MSKLLTSHDGEAVKMNLETLNLLDENQRIKLIEMAKQIIGKLTEAQDLCFDNLIKEYTLDKKREDWVFDYIYNTDQTIEFKDFLINSGKSTEDFFK